MRHKLFLVIAFFFICLVYSCKEDSTFISSGEMEDILYDYHLAQAMASQSKEGYDKTVLEYRAAVLEKYGVSQEKFDTSMVYYMRHTDQLYKIYQNVADRMQNEANKLGASSTGGLTVAGDSANVWSGEKSVVLMPNQPYNVYNFKLKTDTTFHKGDRLILSFKTDFIFQDGARDGIAMLAVTLGNDSVASRYSHLSSSMPMTVQIEDNDSLGIKDIRGFFMLAKNNSMNAPSTTLQLMSLHDIQLIRVHPLKIKKTQPTLPIDGRIPVNKEAPDSERLKPQLMR